MGCTGKETPQDDHNDTQCYQKVVVTLNANIVWKQSSYKGENSYNGVNNKSVPMRYETYRFQRYPPLTYRELSKMANKYIESLHYRHS